MPLLLLSVSPDIESGVAADARGANTMIVMAITARMLAMKVGDRRDGALDRSAAV